MGRKKKETFELTKKEYTVPTKKPKNYLNNADLLKQIHLSRAQDKMTEEFSKMIMMLVDKYLNHPNYQNIFSYVEDIKSFALLTVVRVWRSFNPEKSSNPFAYFTQVIKLSIYQYSNYEKKQRRVVSAIKANQLTENQYSDNHNLFNNDENDDFQEIYDRSHHDLFRPEQNQSIDMELSGFSPELIEEMINLEKDIDIGGIRDSDIDMNIDPDVDIYTIIDNDDLH